jgi:hypothetical protein
LFFAAQGGFLAFLAMLLGAIAAVCQILDYFGIRPRFSSTVRYDGAPCSVQDFRMAEAAARRDGYDSFHGVSASPRVEKDFSLLVAQDQAADRANLVTAYDGLKTVGLVGWEPSIFHAAVQHVAKMYKLSDEVLAQSMALTSRENMVTNGEVQLSSFRLASNGFLLHDRTPVPEYPLGKLLINLPGVTPNNPKESPVLWLKA